MKKLNRLSKVAIGVAAACGVYSALGFWGLPAGLKWAAAGPVSDILGRSLTIEDVKFNPWTLELTASGLKLAANGAGDEPATIGRIYANVAGFSSVTRFGLILDELQVDRVGGLLSIAEDGRTNYQDIIDSINRRFPPKEDEKPGGVFRFSLNNVSLTNSSFHIVSESRHVDENITGINLAIPFVGSIGSDRDIHVKPELRFSDNGSPFEAHGETLPFKDTRATRMHFKLDDYDLAHLGAMIPLNMKVEAGKASVGMDVTFVQQSESEKGVIQIDLDSHAENFRMRLGGDAGKENEASFESLTIAGGKIDLIGKTAEIESVELAKPNVTMSRLANGSVPWAGIAGNGAEKEDKPEASSEKKEESTPFGWVVKNASIRDGSFHFVDHAAGNARVEASNLSATASNITMKEGEETSYKLAARVLDGTLKAEGAVSISELKGRTALDAQKLSLTPVSGYAELAGTTLSGVVSTKSQAEYDFSAGKPAVKAKGSLKLEKFDLGMKGESPIRVKADLLDAGDLAASYTGDADVKISNLSARGPKLSIPNSKVDLGFGGIGAKGFSFGWAEKTGNIAAGAASLALSAPDIRASGFGTEAASFDFRSLKAAWDGKKGNLSAKADKVMAKAADVSSGEFKGNSETIDASAFSLGWAGGTSTADVSAGTLKVGPTRLSSGEFSGSLASTDAAALHVNWNGSKQNLSVSSSSVGIGSADIKASPVSVSSARIGSEGFSLGLDLNSGLKADVKAGRISTSGTSLEVAGKAPVKGALDTLQVDQSAFRMADTLSFSSSKVAAGGLKGSFDLIGFGAGKAEADSVSFTKGKEMAARVKSSSLSQAQVTTPVNAAKVTTLSQSITASGIDWESGASGHVNLGNLSIDSTNFEISGTKAKFGRIARTTVTGVESPARGTVKVASVLIDKPRTMLSRDAKGNLDIDPLLGKRKSAEEAKKVRTEVEQKVKKLQQKAGVEDSRPIRIGEFRVTDGGISFIDNSIKPAGKFNFARMNVTVKPVAIGGANVPSTLSATGRINGAADLTITGNGSPFVDKGKLTAKGKLTGVSMPFFSPYTVHYVSYPIQKGNLSINSDITMKDKTWIKIENHVLMEQLGWGPYIPNETSVSLPVVLATSLLSDSKGDLDFDLPIAGNLADPQFSFSDLVLTGLKNLIIKVVAAPVNILGSLVNLGSSGSSGATVFVPYMSGERRMTAEQKQGTYAQILKGLRDNPKSRIEITPVISTAGDDSALQKRTYSGLLRLAQSTLPEKERTRENTVNALYALQFPDDKAQHTLEEKEAKLYTAVKPDKSNIFNLADARSKNLAKALADDGIDPKRIFITAPAVDKKSNLGGIRLKFLK